jgi:RNA polymerase sigma-70 factor (ECF subfamily)
MAVLPFDYESALAECAGGDQRAFQALYEHESPHMLALSLKLLTHHAAAQRLVADTFMSIWKHARSYHVNIGPARAWIYSIMRHRALGQLRQIGAGSAPVSNQNPSLPVLGPVRTDPINSFTGALGRLNEAQRRAILFAFYHGHTYEQIAATLGLQAGQLRDQVRTGLHQLQEAQTA